MKIKLFFFFALCSLVACNPTTPLPVPEPQLVEVLTDIHYAEALTEPESQVAKDTLLRKYYAEILQKHAVKRPDFDSCIVYLSRDPEQMKKIYSQVMKNIMVRDTAQKH
jgi:hypothetical protein